MAYGVSNGHVTDYDTWSRKAKLDRDPNVHLECSISKTAEDAV